MIPAHKRIPTSVTPKGTGAMSYRQGAPMTLLGLTLVAASFAMGCGSNMDPQVDKALWIANGTKVVEFVPLQLDPGAMDKAPHLVNNSSVFGAPQGVTFDAEGIRVGGQLAVPVPRLCVTLQAEVIRVQPLPDPLMRLAVL